MGISRSEALIDQVIQATEHIPHISSTFSMEPFHTLPAIYDELLANFPLPRKGVVMEHNEQLELSNNQPSQSIDQMSTPCEHVRPVATTLSEIPVPSRCHPAGVESPSHTGGSIDTKLHTMSTSQQTAELDSMPELHPSNRISLASTRSSPRILGNIKPRMYETSAEEPNLENQEVLGGVKPDDAPPLGALEAGASAGDTQTSQTYPKSSTSNAVSISTLTSANVSNAETGPEYQDSDRNADCGTGQVCWNSGADGSTKQQEPRLQLAFEVHFQDPLISFDDATRNPSSSELHCRTLNEKRPHAEDEDAIPNNFGMVPKSKVQAYNLSSAEGKLEGETCLSRATLPRSGAKLDSVEIDVPSNIENKSDLIWQDAKPSDGATAPFKVSSPMANGSSTEYAFRTPVNGSVNVEEAEFETDSSPLDDTSSDTSSLSSSSEDSDGDYTMLDSEEQARILMLGDGGSDDEGRGKSVNGISGGCIKTQNEKSEHIVGKPSLEVTEDMEIEELGAVENLVDNVVLIKAKVSGEYQVLEVGSVLCLKSRIVIGVVAETLGRVQQPLYSVLFTNAAGITEAGIDKGSKIFYVVSHSKFVFTQAIKNMKGSDASNIHDEEVGDDEMEFSDDEAEAAYKRSQKVQKEERHGNHFPSDSMGPSKPARGRGHRHDRGKRDQRKQLGTTRNDEDVKLSYDDPVTTGQGGVRDYDGPYIPLVRPASFHHGNGEDILGESARSRTHPSRNSDSGQSWRGMSLGHTRAMGRGRGRGYQHGSNNGGYTQCSKDNQLSSIGQAASLGYFRPEQYPPTGNNQNSNQHPAYQPTNASFPPQQQAQSPFMCQLQNQTFYQHNQNQSQQSRFPPTSYSPQMPSLLTTNNKSPATYSQNTHMPPTNITQGVFINPAFFAQHSQPSLHNPLQAFHQSSNQSSEAAGANAAFQAAQERLNVLRQLSRGS